MKKGGGGGGGGYAVAEPLPHQAKGDSVSAIPAGSRTKGWAPLATDASGHHATGNTCQLSESRPHVAVFSFRVASLFRWESLPSVGCFFLIYLRFILFYSPSITIKSK